MRELLQQALAALNTCDWDYDYEEESYQTFDNDLVNDAVNALEHELNKPDFLTTDHLSPYEQGFVDGMAKQAQSSVDRAVNAMVTPTLVKLKGNEISFINKPWQTLTDDEICSVADYDDMKFARSIEHLLREKNG